jgi:hypothetical protein
MHEIRCRIAAFPSRGSDLTGLRNAVIELVAQEKANKQPDVGVIYSWRIGGARVAAECPPECGDRRLLGLLGGNHLGLGLVCFLGGRDDAVDQAALFGIRHGPIFAWITSGRAGQRPAEF